MNNTENIMFDAVLEILQRCNDTSSKTEKQKILKSVIGCECEQLFKIVVYLAYDSRYVYNITMDSVNQNSTTIDAGVYKMLATMSDNDVFQYVLDTLNVDAEGTRGTYACMLVNTALHRLKQNPSAAKLLTMCIDRDLRCGVGIKSFNKVWPSLIFYTPFMKRMSFNEKNMKKIFLPCEAEIKYDGLYGDLIVDVQEQEVAVFTRGGKNIVDKLLTSEEITKILQNSGSMVYQGEVLVRKVGGGIEERSIGNAYINSDDVDKSRITFNFWDSVQLDKWLDGEEKTPLTTRRSRASAFVTNMASPKFGLAKRVTCNDIQDIKDFFSEARFEQQEGIILKNLNGIWKDGMSKDEIKVKVVVDCEMQVVDVLPGKIGSKYEFAAGKLLCQSSCGLVIVNVSGMSDKLRFEFYKNPETIIDKIITVRYNDVVNDARSNVYSLYLPRYVEIRFDKTVADDLKKIIEQMESALSVLDILG